VQLDRADLDQAEQAGEVIDPQSRAFAAFALFEGEPVNHLRDRRQFPHVIEGAALDAPHELERPAPEMRKRPLPHLRPVDGEFLFRGRHGVRQELQDVLARHAAAMRPSPHGATRGPGPRGRRRRFPIFAHSLEHGFAQQGMFRHGAVGDFGLDHRLDPGRLRLADRLRERGFLAYEWIEPLAQIARLRFGEAAAHLAGIEQPVALAATHVDEAILRGFAPSFSTRPRSETRRVCRT
jgi:hypothetical protein